MDGNTANNVVGDVGNDVVSGGVVDGVGGNVAGASDGGKKRLGNGPLIAILVVLLAVIVGLGVGIFLNGRQKDFSKEELNSFVDDYLFGSQAPITEDELISRLWDVVDNSDNADDVVWASLNLSWLYGDSEEAIAPLEKALEWELDDMDTYAVLSRLMDLYDKQSEEYRWTLCELSKLPDDLTFEKMSWSLIKESIIEELNVIGGCDDFE